MAKTSDRSWLTGFCEIQMSTEPSQWQHVSTEENPADLCTRGANPSELADSPLWWNGPDWLTKDFKEWSKMKDARPEQTKRNAREENLTEERGHEWLYNPFDK